ncbi:hypothetical protein U1Q18_001719 [Sarracenia purpurea var. burkii]
MENMLEEVALLSQVEKPLFAARSKNSKSNINMASSAKEIYKPHEGVVVAEGNPNALEVFQVQGCQGEDDSLGCGELPEHIYIGIVDDGLDKCNSEFLHTKGMINSKGLFKTVLH